jgi:hypothetical protein
MPYSLAEIATHFANLDGVSERDKPAFDKAIRNISQRHFVRRSQSKGRTDYYDVEAVCVLRILSKAAPFGFTRTTLDRLAYFMQNENSPIREHGEGLSNIEDAIARVRVQGDDPLDQTDFAFHVDMMPDGSFRAISDLDPMANNGKSPWDARFSVPASRLIRELIAHLGNPDWEVPS